MRFKMKMKTSREKQVRGWRRTRLSRKAIAYGCFAALLLPLSGVCAQPRINTVTAKTQAGPMAEGEVMKRANALLAQMTLEEKIGQMTQLFFGIIPDSVKVEDRIRRGEIGSLLFVTDPATINRLQKVAVEESRLRIPLLFGFDVIHGFHTIFPVPLAMAA